MTDPYRFNFIIVTYVTIVYKLVYNINLNNFYELASRNK